MTGTKILHEASASELEQAAAYNHTELFCLDALASNGEVEKRDGILWTYRDPDKGSMIAFPSLPEDRAGAQLDEIIEYYLQYPPNGAGCWSLDPTQPHDLGLMLLARGFQLGWKPCWMALDLEKIKSGYPAPVGLELTPDNTAAILDVKSLPYSDMDILTFQKYPERMQHFVARLDGKIVGHSSVLLTTGMYGAAGIYHVGVLPFMRNRGIGKAVVLAACMYAKNLGYRYAVLNATGLRMYEQLGFKKISDGFTWWLNIQKFLAQPPTKNEIFLAEAIGRGDVLSAEQALKHFNNGHLHAPMTNGMTLMQLAGYFKQQVSAEWLINHDWSMSVLDAWDLGWKDHAASLLAQDHNSVNRQYGELQTTILHIAAERNDFELANLALKFSPDLTIKDKMYHSTPLGWANFFHRKEIIQLISDYTST